MNIIKKNNIEGLFFVGDVHGKYRELVYKIQNTNLSNSIFIVCGDFGMGFHKENYYISEFSYVSKKLSKNNNYIISIRGNHDNPSYFEKITTYDNVILVPDYTIININNDYNILCIGGAISIDRIERKLNIDYWKNEDVYFDEDKLKKLNNINIVVTHDAPDFCKPFIKSNLEERLTNDSKLKDDLNISRQKLTLVHNILKSNNNINDWYYGHHHFYNVDYVNNVNFHLLGELDIKEKRI